jgi:hypothetical protein
MSSTFDIMSSTLPPPVVQQYQPLRVARACEVGHVLQPVR